MCVPGRAGWGRSVSLCFSVHRCGCMYVFVPTQRATVCLCKHRESCVCPRFEHRPWTEKCCVQQRVHTEIDMYHTSVKESMYAQNGQYTCLFACVISGCFRSTCECYGV